MDKIEIHVKQYGITKSKDPKKDGKTIGLQTRLIIHPPVGALKIINFDYLHEANKYIKDTYGDLRSLNLTYMIFSNYKLYGNKGYQWK